MKLSKRLDCIAKLIEQYANEEDILADIGTDHGYLPCFIVKEGILNIAYACDVAKGPLQASKETIRSMDLENVVIPLLGNGLEPVLDKEPTIISISGMGGFLMEDILKAHLEKMPSVHTLVLQPNLCEYVIRQYLCHHGFEIIDEAIIKDVHHRYEVMVFKRSQQKVDYLEEDYLFGPILRKKKPTEFIAKWQRELKIRERVLQSIDDPSHPKYQETLKEMKRIEGVLNENE